MPAPLNIFYGRNLFRSNLECLTVSHIHPSVMFVGNDTADQSFQGRLLV